MTPKRLLDLIAKRKADTFIPGFDPAFYVAEYTDVKSSGLSPEQHYLSVGMAEFRDPNAHFSAKGYLSANPDVAAAGFDPLTHFLLHGLAQNYGGWQRHPPEAVAATPGAAVAATGGITDLNELFKASLRGLITDFERQSLADPANTAIRGTLDYLWFHERRWNMTFRIMAPLVRRSSRIVEVGGASTITEFLIAQGFQAAVATSDLREALVDIADESADIVLCLEVIEHVKDRDGSLPLDVFNETGMLSLIAEMHRILAPGGLVVCTTPNACAYSAIARAARMEPPMFFRKHVREYTPDELRDRFEAAGFETVSLETPPDPWGQRENLDIAEARRMVIRTGGATDLREDDIVAIFRRR